MAYENQSFVKTKNGVKAPAGFHYMPNGKLMSDADHVAVYGYIEKNIKSFNIDTNDISFRGQTRTFFVKGDVGAIFSFEIYNENNEYYNFRTKTWTLTPSKLEKVEITGNSYDVSVQFDPAEFIDATCDYNNDPTITHDDDDGKIQAGMSVAGAGIPAGATVSSITSDTAFELSVSTTGGAVTNGALTFSKLKTYTINLFAETVGNFKTIHPLLSEARNKDNSINLNKSTGSNSNVLTKILYQDIRKNLHLSCIAPSLYAASTNTIAATTSSTNRITIDSGDAELVNVATSSNIVQIGDKVTTAGVAASVHALVTKINPDGDNTNEIEIGITDSVTNNAAITFTPPFNGMTPHSTDSTSGIHTVSVSSKGTVKSAFSITCTAPASRTFSIKKTPTLDDLCVFTTVAFGNGVPILEEDVSGGSFHRWETGNVSNLTLGMTLDPARTGTGLNTTTPAIISNYKTTVTETKIVDGAYSSGFEEVEVENVFVGGIETSVHDATAVDRDGKVTAQAGFTAFNVQQLDALKSDSGVRIFAYGAKQIKELTGIDVSLSNVVVTPTQVSTTTSGAVSGSTTIGLTEVSNVSTASTIRGVGISAAAVNPTVAGKAAATGAVNITASAAQTLESGQTLFFDGASNIVTITGNITVSNMAISDTTLHFDVEKFLTAV